MYIPNQFNKFKKRFFKKKKKFVFGRNRTRAVRVIILMRYLDILNLLFSPPLTPSISPFCVCAKPTRITVAAEPCMPIWTARTWRRSSTRLRRRRNGSTRSDTSRRGGARSRRRVSSCMRFRRSRGLVFLFLALGYDRFGG